MADSRSMTDKNHATLAQVFIILHRQRATDDIMRAIILLDDVLPLSGTPERREAFLAAYAAMGER